MCGSITASSTRAPWIRTCGACAKSWGRRRNTSIRYAGSATGLSRLEPSEAQVWPVLTILALVTLAMVHLRWQRKFTRAEAILRREIGELRRYQQQASAQLRIRQEAVFNSMAEGLVLLDENGRIEL